MGEEAVKHHIERRFCVAITGRQTDKEVARHAVSNKRYCDKYALFVDFKKAKAHQKSEPNGNGTKEIDVEPFGARDVNIRLDSNNNY